MHTFIHSIPHILAYIGSLILFNSLKKNQTLILNLLSITKNNSNSPKQINLP